MRTKGDKGAACGVFLDPPYCAPDRAELYCQESYTVANDVESWALATGTDPRYRIVVAGFDGDYPTLSDAAGWRCAEWFKGRFLKGGMALQSGRGTQQRRERLWFSPHCLPIDAGVDDAQGRLL